MGINKTISRRSVVKGFAGLALTTSLVGCSKGSPTTKTTSKPKATIAQGTQGKLIIVNKNAGGSAAWSPDGQRIASIDSNNNIIIWEVASGKTLLTYTGHTGGAELIAWSPDGKRIVSTGAYDSTGTPLIHIWDTSTGKLLRPYTRPDNNITGAEPLSAIGWSPDGNYIASSMVDVQVWSPDTGDLVYERIVNDPTSNSVFWLNWSPDSKRLSATTRDGANDNAFTWDALTGNNQIGYQIQLAGQLVWSPDGSKLVSDSKRGLDIWDAVSGQNLHSESDATLITQVAWSPDGKLIASGGEDNQIRLWEPLTGHTVYTYKGHLATSTVNSSITSIAWSPDSSMIASVDDDNVVQVWRTR